MWDAALAEEEEENDDVHLPLYVCAVMVLWKNSYMFMDHYVDAFTGNNKMIF